MTEHCAALGDQLAPYVDGELDAADAEAFAMHLAGCASCRAGLHDALQLAALETRAASAPMREAKPRAARDRVRRWSRRSKLAAAGSVMAVAAAVLLAVRFGDRGGPAAPDAPVVLATADVRSLEGRISYPAADRYRRYSVARAAGPAAAADVIPLTTLAALEHRGDLQGVAAAYLLLGEPSVATRYLDRAPASADVIADRALVRLAAGHPAEALVALEGVLETSPRHPQARWNRALALRDLGLPRMAVEAFAAVAELGEPGWTAEARDRGKAIADEADARKAAVDHVLAAGPRLAVAPDGISAELARRVPGTTRLYFYDAVRGAATADAVRALAPLARTLDAVAGGRTLADYVDRVAHADFTRRGALAARYARVVAGEALAPAAARELLAALRSAHQDDILIGAMILTSPDRRTVPAALLPELARLAEATGDPWFRLLAIEQRANALLSAGDFAAVELAVLPALAGCRTSRLDFRCMRLDHTLAGSYLFMLRLSDARRVIGEGTEQARRTGEWYFEQAFLPQLATLEMIEDDVSASTLPLARAHVGELVHRDPRCANDVWGGGIIAMMLINRADLDGARAALERPGVIAGCPSANATMVDVFVKAHVARDDQVPAVRAEIASVRTMPTTTPGELAALDQIEGQLLIERDRAAGISLLERAMATARKLPSNDVDARKAESYAHTILTLDAGRAGDWQRAWQRLGDGAGISIERCGLGVATEGLRSVTVVRDASGAFAGAYQMMQRPKVDPAQLMPAALRDRLRGCDEIDVIARPPIEGTPALLPDDMVWSYRSGVTRSARATPPAAGPRLVISNAEPPAELNLPRLVPWRSSAPADVVLESTRATPANALAALADAGFVEIHAHGMMNAAVSDASFITLSADPDGHYALTASEIRARALRGRPIVVLAACHAGATASYRHEPWGLPAAFIEAGARAVIASPDVIADADAGAFFDALRLRTDRGTSPARALHDVRVEWLASHPEAAWVRSLMVFQ